MAELIPIEELIVQNVVTTLNAVTTGATYANTLTAKAPEQVSEADSPANGLVIVGSLGCEESPLPVTGKQRYILNLDLVAYAVVSESQVQGTVRKRLAQLATDIKKALLVDRYRGVYGHNTRFVGRGNGTDTEYDELASPPFVTVHVAIDFQTAYGNPYSL